jgi:hypothetical protein
MTAKPCEREGSAPITRSQASLAGWYAGLIGNKTSGNSPGWATFEQNGQQLRGCLLVYPPLGSGAHGQRGSSALLLNERTSGTRSPSMERQTRDVGSYVVNWSGSHLSTARWL